MLIEIHVLQNLAPSNPNRDDMGAPKSAVFGGKLRGRISSQCLKRSIRWFDEFQKALKGHLGTRTKFFPNLVRAELSRSSIPPDKHSVIVQKCISIGTGKEEDQSGARIASNDEDDDRPKTPQLIFLGPNHAEEFVKRLDRLRTEMPDEFTYFCDPKASFKENVEDALAKSAIHTEHHEKIAKNSWSLVTRLYDELMRSNDDEQPISLPAQQGPEEAVRIVQRLEELQSSDPDRYERLRKSDKMTAAAKKKLRPEERQRIEAQEKADAEVEKIKKPGKKTWEKFNKILKEAHKYDTVDIALFGRMTTSDAFEDVEACLEVAHAISTNEMAREVDYFTALDDLNTGMAAAHIGNPPNQFTSNCYYKYFSLDWRGFVATLAGEKKPTLNDPGRIPTPEEWASANELARTALKELIRATVLAMPTGKKKGHANNNVPEAVLVEVKKKHVPTSYANAFLTPAVPSADGNPMDDSIRKLGHYAQLISRGYGIEADRFWFDLHGRPLTYTPPTTAGKAAQTETLAPSLETLLDLVDIAFMEHIATPEARNELDSLAQTKPESTRTKAAKAALDRLAASATAGGEA